MAISALNRKLVREITRMRGQVATIALVLAGGIACYVSLRGTYLSLESARESYYDRQRFAHAFARLERAPESLARRLQTLPRIAALETRISKEITLPIEGMARPAYARLVSLPEDRQPATNALYFSAGRAPARGHPEEVAVLQSFAQAHGLEPGHHLPAVIDGNLRQLVVVGIVQSPEFVYSIRPGAPIDDPKRYASVWMGRKALAQAFRLESAFNEVSFRLEPGANEAVALASIDRLLAPYGGDGAFARHDQLSNRILEQELGQLRALAGMVPVVFLGVAAFLINLVLGRMIRLQRAEIAALKAIGYTNRELGLHYLGLVAVVLAPGFSLGLVGGRALGRPVLALYANVFRFPHVEFDLSLELAGSALLVSAMAAIAGALIAVRAAVALPPAEAMRPPSPARYRRGLLDRLGMGAVAGPNGLMILREIRVHPLRTALSAAGIAGAIALMILGRFGLDSLDSYLEGSYRREQRQDLAVGFARPLSVRAVGELAHLPGVLRAEGVRAFPIRAAHLQRKRDAVFLGLSDTASLRRIIARDGSERSLPSEGVIVSRALGEVLQLQIGDRIDLDVREGNRRTITPVIDAFVDDTAGLWIYGSTRQASLLRKDDGAVSQVLLSVAPSEVIGVEAHLRRSPLVIDVSDAKDDVQRLRDMNGSAMDIWTAISLSLSASIVFGVVYNNARIALESRSRDLASLRVLGFTRGEISTILIGGLLIEVLLAIPVGLILGRLWAGWFMSTVDKEAFRWTVAVAPRTYVLASALCLLAAAASALWVRRSLDHLDLIGVLKTRE